MDNSFNKERIHTTYVATNARQWYSTSMLELEFVDYFFEPQAIRLLSAKHIIWIILDVIWIESPFGIDKAKQCHIVTTFNNNLWFSHPE